ncbi:hypothetical protein SUGI_1086520 [Cryptomeria japonica]|uniref:18.1 kDa class I heat shock protein-like n=1 Tax=Cryptomeria japonica TaxID=3369 RepID=UPI0024149D6E|nr:18.1 kDa class I heat shock protein-like [Cryptomeria japonica]GLJ51028.1 hypothetical protein SUGI_1086520 [Cryptomeria japonica]
MAQSDCQGRRGGVVMDSLDLTSNMWELCANTDLAHTIYIPVDWLETDQAHIFKANLPGLKKEDVKVQVEDKCVMYISGECKKDEVNNNDKWHRLERPHGPFSRRFRLPGNAMLDQVKANMTNGVLTVTIPKAAESKPKVMPINISEN